MSKSILRLGYGAISHRTGFPHIQTRALTMKRLQAEEWLPSASGLGESPLYRASDDTFFFADIKNCLVHSVPCLGGWQRRKTYEFNECITRLHTVANQPDVLAAQTKLGFAMLSLLSGTLKPILPVRHQDASLDEKVRMNDGVIDARGRWWAGSMSLDEETPLGRLWRISKSKEICVLDTMNVVHTPVPNGPVFSPDDRIMYACETPEGKIFQYDYDIVSGTASNKQLFVLMEDGGMPDGMAVDTEGHIWVAANSQGKLVRYSPAGEPVAECIVPGAKMVSCPAFGGKDMRTLFITSIAAEESTGHVYRVNVEVPGVARYEYQA